MGKDGNIGSGKRFTRLERKLARKPGVKDPAALAAFIGRKKYGTKRFTTLAVEGRKRAAKAKRKPALAVRRRL